MRTTELSWETLDWAALDRLRGTFLDGTAGRGAYWQGASDLANYDFTFAQRIGWKWDAVLRELRQRHWTPPASDLLDWGCGSGIAGRSFVRFFGETAFRNLWFSDQSPFAVEFASRAARSHFPSLGVEAVDAGALERDGFPGIVLLSHVLNELSAAARQSLRKVIERAAAVVWIEPGTHETSRELIGWREALVDEFDLVAPCTHQAQCGMLAAGNERHWCHHFAAPPAGILGDSNWVRFARRAGIDLRSLPYSFLALERKGVQTERTPRSASLPGLSRIIGEPRIYKGFARVLSCQADGVRELRLQKRVNPGWFRAMQDGNAGPLQRWHVQGTDIISIGTESND